MCDRLILICLLSLFSCERTDCYGIGSKGVCIKLVNKSGKRTKKITVISGPDSKTMVRILENNAETFVSYYSKGESSYKLLIVMENGDTIKSSERYAEGGYEIKETIHRNKLVPSYKSY